MLIHDGPEFRARITLLQRLSSIHRRTQERQRHERVRRYFPEFCRKLASGEIRIPTYEETYGNK